MYRRGVVNGLKTVFTGSGLVLVAWFALVAKASAAPIISITPDSPSKTVIEGQSGLFDFTVRNLLSAGDVAITRLMTKDSIIYDSGDKDDEVYATLTGADNCTGKTLGPGGTCLFTEIFRTRDLSGVNDHNVGVWDIFNGVFYTGGGVEDEIGVGQARVIVKDVFEPSALALFSLALLSLVGARPRRPR